MAITPDGWFDWMERGPGPAEKVYSVRNSAKMFLPHSMVGSLNGWYSRLFDMSKNPDGTFTDNAAASVHGSVLLTGKAIQHYPIFASCWASGSGYPNCNGVAFEHESVYSRIGGTLQPDESKGFTAEQVATDIRIIRDLAAFRNWPEIRRPRNDRDTGAQLYEHNECKSLWGSDPTACPSSRVPWNEILALLGAAPAFELEEDDIMPVPWIDCQAPNGKPYRSYIIVAGRKVHVASKAQEDAFKAAGYIGDRKRLSLAELKAIPSAPGTPEPDA